MIKACNKNVFPEGEKNGYKKVGDMMQYAGQISISWYSRIYLKASHISRSKCSRGITESLLTIKEGIQSPH